MWPVIAPKPTSVGVNPIPRANIVGNNPLAMSRSKTGIAHPIPRVRDTLVNPILPEPFVLISIPVILPVRKPNGIEPGKKPKKSDNRAFPMLILIIV